MSHTPNWSGPIFLKKENDKRILFVKEWLYIKNKPKALEILIKGIGQTAPKSERPYIISK